MIRIIGDSTCDLSKDIIKKYNFSILPLHILLEEKEYLDGVNIKPKDIYKWSDKNELTPKTSAPSIEDAINILKPLVEKGDMVISFHISERLSTSANVMRLAAGELECEDKVVVIDSKNLSGGVGILMLRAAKLIEENRGFDEIVEDIRECINKVSGSFIVDKLNYLKRGGRCSGVAAFAGEKLKLHPVLELVDGEIINTKKYRGKMSQVIMDLVKLKEGEMEKAKKDAVIIAHSGELEDTIKLVKKYLEEKKYFKEVILMEAGGVISSHCGPSTFGIFYIK